MAKPYDWRNDYDWTDPNDGPANWDEHENVQDIMLDQGIPYGEQVKSSGGGEGIMRQASGIRPEIRIEEVVKEFIRAKGRKPISIEEIKEFYFNEMGTADSGTMKTAGGYPQDVLDEYENYKLQQIDIDPSKVLEIDDWYRSEYEASRSNVQAGGLAGILGV